MNIVYATTAAVPYPSAASINTMQMCESLANLGHQVTLAVGRKFWRPAVTRLDCNRFYGFQPSFEIRRFYELPRCGFCFDAAIVRLARCNEALVYLRYPRLLPRLTEVRVPTILEVHSALDERAYRAISDGLQVGQLLGVVTITESLKQHLLKSSFLESFHERVIVAPDAVDPVRFDRGPLCADTNNVGYVGSLYAGKGMERIERIASRLPKTNFLVYGGRLRERRHWARRCRTLSNVRLCGRVRPADVPAQMSQFTIALLPNEPSVRLPSGDDIGQYTSPLKLFEYMAAGKAIVASDLPNLREVLTHEQNSLLVKCDDDDAWAQAIRRLQLDTGLRQRLARQASKDAREKYAYRVRFRKILTRLVPNDAAHPHDANEGMQAA